MLSGQSGQQKRISNHSILIIMNKPISLVLFFVGIILVIYGVSASDSIGSDVSRFFTGSPTDKTIWLLIGGAVAAAVGASGLMRGSKSS
jgi:hypothetical protein